MALVTVQRSPTPSNGADDALTEEDLEFESRSLGEGTPDGSANKIKSSGRSLLQIAVIPTETKRLEFIPSVWFSVPRIGVLGEIQQHLQAMLHLLRPQDTMKMVVRLETMFGKHVRYMAIVESMGRQDNAEATLLGIDHVADKSETVIGLVVPIWADTEISLDGDGHIAITSCGTAHHVFKPVSVQAMWSAFQSLHKQQALAAHFTYFPGGLTHTWVSYYQSRITSSDAYLSEWHHTSYDDSGLKAQGVSECTEKPAERAKTEKLIRQTLKEIMQEVDLEEVTSIQIRMKLQERLQRDLTEYKEFAENEMLVILGQMDKPSQILPYLYLGTEWNASNLEELRANNVGYILNATKEVDNFFPGLFRYMKIRISDEESTELLKYWDDTYKFIKQAAENNTAVLVHCKKGISRSSSTVVAYVMKEKQWDLDTSIKYVQEIRNCIKPNQGFMAQLETYQGILAANQNRNKPHWNQIISALPFGREAVEYQAKRASRDALEGCDQLTRSSDCICKNVRSTASKLSAIPICRRHSTPNFNTSSVISTRSNPAVGKKILGSSNLPCDITVNNPDSVIHRHTSKTSPRTGTALANSDSSCIVSRHGSFKTTCSIPEEQDDNIDLLTTSDVLIDYPDNDSFFRTMIHTDDTTEPDESVKRLSEASSIIPPGNTQEDEMTLDHRRPPVRQKLVSIQRRCPDPESVTLKDMQTALLRHPNASFGPSGSGLSALSDTSSVGSYHSSSGDEVEGDFPLKFDEGSRKRRNSMVSSGESTGDSGVSDIALSSSPGTAPPPAPSLPPVSEQPVVENLLTNSQILSKKLPNVPEGQVKRITQTIEQKHGSSNEKEKATSSNSNKGEKKSKTSTASALNSTSGVSQGSSDGKRSKRSLFFDRLWGKKSGSTSHASQSQTKHTTTTATNDIQQHFSQSSFNHRQFWPSMKMGNTKWYQQGDSVPPQSRTGHFYAALYTSPPSMLVYANAHYASPRSASCNPHFNSSGHVVRERMMALEQKFNSGDVVLRRPRSSEPKVQRIRSDIEWRRMRRASPTRHSERVLSASVGGFLNANSPGLKVRSIVSVYESRVCPERANVVSLPPTGFDPRSLRLGKMGRVRASSVGPCREPKQVFYRMENKSV